MKIRRALTIALAAVLCGMCLFPLSCTKKNEVKKTDAATEKKQPARAGKDEIVAKAKSMYICPNLNVSMAEAEKKGGLCPEGEKIMGLVEKMIAGNMDPKDIYYLVENYRIQGRSMVSDNGQPACAAADGKLKLDFFIMSYCPFGVKFVDTALRPMVADIGESMDWKPYYILDQGPDGKLASMHGQQEVDEDMRQICIREKQGMQKWLDYMSCYSPEVYAKAKSGDAKDWKFCAAKAGLDAGEIQSCSQKEAPEMAKKDIEMSRMYGANGSPTAVYNCSKNIVGAMPYESIKSHICDMFAKGKAPARCGG